MSIKMTAAIITKSENYFAIALAKSIQTDPKRTIMTSMHKILKAASSPLV
jgi:hypothetical protein